MTTSTVKAAIAPAFYVDGCQPRSATSRLRYAIFDSTYQPDISVGVIHW